ncbi:MAG TPA: LysR family transcriptional regulator [Polyangiaceae bacterium]
MPRESLRWDDVRVFLAIYRSGSMSGASRALKVDQTTVGRRLQALEESLDARLFDRTPDGLSLTPAGEGILDVAERVEESMLALERRIGGEDARIAGTVRIATSDAFAQGYLVSRLRALRDRHPDLVIELTTGQTFVALSRREADIALRMRPIGAPPSEENVVCRRLYEVPWSLYASRAYVVAHGAPSDANDLAGRDVIDLDDEAPALPGRDWLRRASEPARVRLRVTNLLSVVAAVRAGLGLGLLPGMFAGADPPLVRIGQPVASAEGWLLVHPDLQRVARVRAVIDTLAELARQDGPLLRGEAPASP